MPITCSIFYPFYAKFRIIPHFKVFLVGVNILIITFLNTCKLPCYAPVWHKLRALGCVVLSLALSACATMSDFSSWTVGYNKSVEQARNQLMLLNIIRASENMPLLFTGIQVVRGNGQTSVGGALGITRTVQAVSLGAPITNTTIKTLAPSVNLQVASGFNFDVVVLDSAEFMQGLLTPISVLTFNHYVRQGIPLELLLHLLTEKITITTPGRPTVTYVNDPLSRDYKEFRLLVTALLKLRLTTEVVNSPSEAIGPLLTDADLKSGASTEFSKALPGLFLTKVPGGYRFIRPGSTTANFCFLGEETAQSTLPQTSLCANSPMRKAKQATPDGDELANKKVLTTVDWSMSVQMSSTNDVFNYLGRLESFQLESGNDILTLDSPEAIAYNRQGQSRAVFNVIKNQPKPNDIASVQYRGIVYSLPLEAQGFSATTLMVLNQLFSLSKSVNSIPGTGTVLVR